jgi:hypothetical protein
MSESVNERWYRWDKLANDKKYGEIVAEFDDMLKKKKKVTVGDLVRRDEALESMGVTSINQAILKRKGHDKTRKRNL